MGGLREPKSACILAVSRGLEIALAGFGEDGGRYFPNPVLGFRRPGVRSGFPVECQPRLTTACPERIELAKAVACRRHQTHFGPTTNTYSRHPPGRPGSWIGSPNEGDADFGGLPRKNVKAYIQVHSENAFKAIANPLSEGCFN